MALSAADLAAILDRARAAVETSGPPADRAAAVAAVVHSAWPAAAVTACRIISATGTAAAVVDKAGRPHPDLAGDLPDHLVGSEGEVTIGGSAVRTAAVTVDGRGYGVLAAAIADRDEPLLCAIARVVAEALDRAAATDELADRDRLADVGEIVGPVTHEFNNFLNTLMLQLAVMEMSAGDAAKAELQGLKRQGKRMATIIRQLQLHRRQRSDAAAPADLNRAAETAVDDVERKSDEWEAGPRLRRPGSARSEDVLVRLRLDHGLPLVSGPAADLRRLCRFLLTGAAPTIAGGGSLVLTTAPAGGGVTLRVEAIGASGGSLARLLDGSGGEGINGLELAAAQSLVRRLSGSMRTEPAADGEAIVVELPAANG
jgi:signal transduction histidine kinase